MDGVVQEFEADCNNVPEEAALYQTFTFPDDAAEIDTVPVPHRCPFVPVGAVGMEFIVAVTAERVAEIHPVDALRDSA